MYQEANGCDTEMKELREHQQTISEQLEQKQVNCQQLQGALDTMDGDIERALEVKQRVSSSTFDIVHCSFVVSSGIWVCALRLLPPPHY